MVVICAISTVPRKIYRMHQECIWPILLFLAVSGVAYGLEQCSFPFNYNGVDYSTCSEDTSTGKYWCSLTPIYSGKWRYCTSEESKLAVQRATLGMDPASKPCIFPFEHNGEMHPTCIKDIVSRKYWCSLTPRYDGLWRYCTEEESVQAVEHAPLVKNAGKTCIFPFLYKRETHTRCATDRHSGKYWCSLTGVYNESLWRYCTNDEANMAKLNDQQDLIYPLVDDHTKIAMIHRSNAFQTIEATALFSVGTLSLPHACGSVSVQCGTYSSKCVWPPEMTNECARAAGNVTHARFDCHDCKYVYVEADCSVTKEANFRSTPMDFEDREKQAVYNKYLKAWQPVQDQLLAGTTQIQRFKGTGFFDVIRQNAAALITTENNRVIMTGSEHKDGRVIAFSHMNYGYEILNNTVRAQVPMYNRILRWLSPNCSTVESINVLMLRYEADYDAIKWCQLNRCTVIVWMLRQQLGGQRVDKIISHVANGGGLVVALNAWEYRQIYSPSRRTEIDKLIAILGIDFNSATEDSSWAGPFQPVKLTNQKSVTEPLEVLLLRSAASLQAWTSLTWFNNLSDRLVETLMRHWFEDFRKILITMINRYYRLAETFTPCYAYGVSETHPYLLRYNYLLNSQLLTNSGIKAPGAFLFPGDTAYPQTAYVTKIFKVQPTARMEYHPTGLYLPAGGTLKAVTVSNNSNSDNFQIVIQASSYMLSRRKSIHQRWPEVRAMGSWDVSSTHVFSAFGGVVWIRNFKASNIVIQISHAVEASTWDVRQPQTLIDWNNRTKKHGLWSDISGDAVTLTVPTKSTNSLSGAAIAKSLQLIDRCIKLGYHTLGLNISKATRMIVGHDVQIWMGSMHSGYPIGAMLSAINPRYPNNFLLNPKSITERGRWALMHEIGHNQQDERWTYSGSTEVTCNIFSILCDTDRNGSPTFDFDVGWMKAHDVKSITKSHLLGKVGFGGLKSSYWLHLTFFMHLQYNFGWEFYRQFFRLYNNPNLSPKTDEAKHDLWLLNASNITECNLAPLFEFWGFPVREEAYKKIVAMSLFLPDDKITQLAPLRVQAILQKYPTASRSCHGPKNVVGPPTTDELEKLQNPRILSIK